MAPTLLEPFDFVELKSEHYYLRKNDESIVSNSIEKEV